MLDKISQRRLIIYTVAVAILLVSASLFLLSDGNDEERTQEQIAESFVGLTEERAVELAETEGISYRVVEKDDEFITITDDLNPRRINFSIESGKVVKAELY